MMHKELLVLLTVLIKGPKCNLSAQELKVRVCNED